MRSGLVRVLVIDDSAFSRRTITRMLESSPLVRVVDCARDGEEALRKTLELEPDLVTLDLEMPRMDGFTYLRLLLARRPTPVLVISGRAASQDVFTALELGAMDFIAKPTPRAAPELETIRQALLSKVHALRELRLDLLHERVRAAPDRLRPRAAGRAEAAPLVAFGASTGGPAALLRVLGSFAEPLPCPVLVSQHMPAGFTASFAERLDRQTAWAAREARDGDALEPGCVLVAPGDRHLELEAAKDGVKVRVQPRSPGDRYAPSVDRMLESAAKQLGPRVLAVVLTGMGDDGAAGVRAVKAAGGRVLAESEQSAVVYGMPQQAIQSGAVDAVLPLWDIPAALAGSVAPAAPCVGRAGEDAGGSR